MNTVTSADGTTIAYTKEGSGSGPAMVAVNTSLEDHNGMAGIASLLSDDFTVYRYDRRGRGESGNTEPYSPQREIEDLEAVIAEAGGAAALISGSGGCVLSLDAATALGEKVTGLYLYEPPFIIDDSRPPVPNDLVERVSKLVAGDQRDEAVEAFFVEAVGVPAEFIDGMKADPSWQGMKENAHTLPYDVEICQPTQRGQELPADRWDVSVPATVSVGGDSEPFFHSGAKALADLLPKGRYKSLEGLDHGAFWMAPDTVAEDARNDLNG
ncbi:MAG: alpha/beta fold hydrolase [Acidimicrobiia bacterium]|nr:alpha/beta fold hydrolase [Acidimicrobiia bacterium]